MDPLIESMLLNPFIDDEEKEQPRSPNQSDSEETSDGENKSTFQSPQQQQPQSIRPHGPQTGPKGVLADHAFHKRQIEQQKREAIKAYNEKMLSKAITTTSYNEDERLSNLQNNDEELLKELEDAETNEEEKKILEEYREKRLKEIRTNQIHRLYSYNSDGNKKFGILKEISLNQYVKAIDEESSNVNIIVHIFDNSIPQCRLLNDCLAHLARKYVKAKFLRIVAIDLDFDVIGLPTLLVYRDGKLIVNLVKVTDEIKKINFDVDDVEDILIRRGALNPGKDIDECYSEDYSYGFGKSKLIEQDDNDDD